MNFRQWNWLRALPVMSGLLVAGCSGTIILPGIGSDEITVRVFNNTDFEIDPFVEYGLSETSLVGVDAGLVLPGETIEFDLFCDDAILLTTTESTQYGLLVDYVLEPLPLFQIDRDFFCGEVVDFEFVGNGEDFNVFVDAGGENIY